MTPLERIERASPLPIDTNVIDELLREFYAPRFIELERGLALGPQKV